MITLHQNKKLILGLADAIGTIVSALTALILHPVLMHELHNNYVRCFVHPTLKEKMESF